MAFSNRPVSSRRDVSPIIEFPAESVLDKKFQELNCCEGVVIFTGMRVSASSLKCTSQAVRTRSSRSSLRSGSPVSLLAGDPERLERVRTGWDVHFRELALTRIPVKITTPSQQLSS